jgi:hypothetical protein
MSGCWWFNKKKKKMSAFEGVHYSSKNKHIQYSTIVQQREMVFGLISPFLIGKKGSRSFCIFGSILTEAWPDLSYLAR